MPFKDEEAGKAYKREYYNKNSKKISEQVKNRRLKILSSPDKEKYLETKREICRKYYHNNKHKYKTTKSKNLKSCYNMTIDDYNILLANQNRKCLICGSTSCTRKLKDPRYPLCVDHDHSTGIVRGLLCHSCNVLLGYCKEDINILNNAIKYLENCKK